jgi:hypothetical protein
MSRPSSSSIARRWRRGASGAVSLRWRLRPVPPGGLGPRLHLCVVESRESHRGRRSLHGVLRDRPIPPVREAIRPLPGSPDEADAPPRPGVMKARGNRVMHLGGGVEALMIRCSASRRASPIAASRSGPGGGRRPASVRGLSEARTPRPIRGPHRLLSDLPARGRPEPASASPRDRYARLSQDRPRSSARSSGAAVRQWRGWTRTCTTVVHARPRRAGSRSPRSPRVERVRMSARDGSHERLVISLELDRSRVGRPGP